MDLLQAEPAGIKTPEVWTSGERGAQVTNLRQMGERERYGF